MTDDFLNQDLLQKTTLVQVFTNPSSDEKKEAVERSIKDLFRDVRSVENSFLIVLEVMDYAKEKNSNPSIPELERRLSRCIQKWESHRQVKQSFLYLMASLFIKVRHSFRNSETFSGSLVILLRLQCTLCKVQIVVLPIFLIH